MNVMSMKAIELTEKARVLAYKMYDSGNMKGALEALKVASDAALLSGSEVLIKKVHADLKWISIGI